MNDSDSIQFDPPEIDGRPGFRWVKIICLILPAFLLGMFITKLVHWHESQYVNLHTTDAMRGLVIEGMRIHRLNSSPESLNRISDQPTSYGFPIAQSRVIESPWTATYIWKTLIDSGTERKGRRTEGKDIFPQWSVEIDNGDRIRTVLVDTQENVMIFVSDSRWYHHGIVDFPESAFESALVGDYDKIPEWEPEPTPAPKEKGVIRFEYKSRGSPSWPDSFQD